MNTIVVILGLLWFGRIAINILSYIHLWYIKEYRPDRMWIHLLSPQGKTIFWPAWRRPPITIKTILLTCISLTSIAIVASSISGSWMVKAFVSDLVTFPLISLWVILFRLPTNLYHYFLIQRAIGVLAAHAPMKVIGITGSYGKTSTKELIATLLSTKYKTLFTTQSKNSPIAIAELVLSTLTPKHTVFVVEMGAYKTGEIRQMSAMVHPTIAVITAINPQHQDLFGSIEQTMKAKYELIAGMNRDGVAIMNADNDRVREMAKQATADGYTVEFYSALRHKDAAITAKNIQQHESGISFDCVYKGKAVSITVQLFGTHHVSNMLAAIAVCLHSGMTMDEIIKASRMIKPVSHTMTPLKGKNGAMYIDDTFNNNPDAALAALSFLSAQKGKKMVVFQPMIELGAYAKESHQRVARVMGEIATDIILTNDSFAEVFEAHRGNARVQVMKPREAAEYIVSTVKDTDTVLFKGKEAARVLQLLV
jgi:UDP-N-acetylmuramoyl-tripeptide--D-alanyl-D-alanine ligase